MAMTMMIDVSAITFVCVGVGADAVIFQQQDSMQHQVCENNYGT